MIELYLSALAMGFLGSVHCIGMCGGITIAFNQTTSSQKNLRLTTTYQLFRIFSYSLLGGLVAILGRQFSTITDFPILPLFSAILMLMLGLYLLNVSNLLLQFEKIGHFLWRRLRPIQKKFLPIRHYHQAMIIGMLWGFLPCGLVYSALALAVTGQSALDGFITMLCFGVGTLPALIGVGVASRQLLDKLQQPNVRRALACFFILWACYYAYQVMLSEHQHHSQQQTTVTTEHHNHH